MGGLQTSLELSRKLFTKISRGVGVKNQNRLTDRSFLEVLEL